MDYTKRPAYQDWKARQVEAHAIVRDSRRATGLCVKCGGVRDTDGSNCSNCRKKSQERRRKRKEKNIEESCNLCYKQPRALGFKRCQNCLDKIRSKAKERNAGTRRWRTNLIKEVQEGYGNKCACCGETEPLFLEIDHIHNDGAAERKTLKGNSLYLKLKKDGFPKDRYQLLCNNCNVGKHRNKGVCPHLKA